MSVPAIRKCCEMLSLPLKKISVSFTKVSLFFKRRSAVSKEYHNLEGEGTIQNLVQTPPKNLNSGGPKESPSCRSSSTKASEHYKESNLDGSNLEEKFDLEEGQSEIKNSEGIELTTIALENPLEKYFKMGPELAETLQRKILEESNDFEKVFEETKLPHNLKIFMKSVAIDKKSRISFVKSEWIAPCAPERLLEIMNDIEIQKKISNSSLDQFYSFESFGALKNFNLMYLRYKKMLTASPRDFVYFKYFCMIDQEKNIWVDCSKSIEDDRFPEIKSETVRGDICISGTYIEKFEQDGAVLSKVVSYSEIDFKLNLPMMLTKPTTVSEFRKYVERTCQILDKGEFA